MKKRIATWVGLVLVIGLAGTHCKQTNQAPTASTTTSIKKESMKLNAGVITAKLAESKEFYQRVLNFGVTFENDFYVLMHTPGQQASFSLLLPNHPSQQPIFHTAFEGKGMYLTIEVDDVDAEYKRIKDLGVNITVPIRDEPWGDRHFAIYDPNGVGIDIVKYSAPQ
jgi:catechol 2,3-dioxygenase-like lactoylglutathione lyase family enzyme